MTVPDPIVQDRLPFLAWMDPRTRKMPGILPLERGEWVFHDEAFAGQMARRDALIASVPQRVHAILPQAAVAAAELYTTILEQLAGDPGYRIGPSTVLRPDGVEIALDPSQPLLTLGRLVQEDLCLLQPSPEGHRLTGAILCFPASWTLAQKIGAPLLRIHEPVPQYDARAARGVQRLFDAIRPEQPLWRMNFLTYDDPELHQPRLEGVQRPRPTCHSYVRSEAQVLARLPKSRAVVFAIHTWQVRAESIAPAEFDALLEALE